MGELVEIVANTPKFNFILVAKNRHEIHTGPFFWPIRHRLFNLFTGTDFNVLVIFFVLKLGVYVRPVKSLFILRFYLSKQLKDSSRTQNWGLKRL